MKASEIKLNETWRTALHEEFDKPYFDSLVNFLKSEKAKKQQNL